MSDKVVAKAKQYLTEGKIKVKVLNKHEAIIQVTGSSIYSTTFNQAGWTCSCPAVVPECAHIVAAKLITDLRVADTRLGSNISDDLTAFLDSIKLKENEQYPEYFEE